jgi:hypothetical protein
VLGRLAGYSVALATVGVVLVGVAAQPLLVVWHSIDLLPG